MRSSTMIISVAATITDCSMTVGMLIVCGWCTCRNLRTKQLNAVTDASDAKLLTARQLHSSTLIHQEHGHIISV
jgi:predicted nuclease of predicted toxin-antitoxin system